MGECKWLCHFWVNYPLMVMFEDFLLTIINMQSISDEPFTGLFLQMQ